MLENTSKLQNKCWGDFTISYCWGKYVSELHITSYLHTTPLCGRDYSENIAHWEVKVFIFVSEVWLPPWHNQQNISTPSEDRRLSLIVSVWRNPNAPTLEVWPNLGALSENIHSRNVFWTVPVTNWKCDWILFNFNKLPLYGLLPCFLAKNMLVNAWVIHVCTILVYTILDSFSHVSFFL